MARNGNDDDGAEVPEADRLEQEEQVVPEVAEDPGWPAPPARDEVDEGDLLEQAQEVPDDSDEAYAPDQP